jgi:hypothetical protein
VIFFDDPLDIDISVCQLCTDKGRVKGRKTISLPLSDG